MAVTDSWGGWNATCRRLRLTIGLLSVLCVTALARPTFCQDIQYKADPDAAKKMTLLLKDFDPQSMLHVAVHRSPARKIPRHRCA